MQHPSIEDSEFCDEPTSKEKIPDDGGTFIESPRFTDTGLPTILLSHPPPSSREALPPIRTFQLGQKDVNVVPPLPKKLPPVPDDIRIPQSFRPAENDLTSIMPNIEPVPEPFQSISVVPLPTGSQQAGSDIRLTMAVVEASTARLENQSESDEQAVNFTERPGPSELESEAPEQLREASTIAAPASVIVTSETQGKSKVTSSKPIPKQTPLKQERSTLARGAKPKTPAPKTAVIKKPVSKTVTNRSVRSETAGKKRQTPRLKSDLTSISLAKDTLSTMETNAERINRELTEKEESIIVSDEKFLQPTNVIDSMTSKTGETDNVQGLGEFLSLENDLTIVSTANEDFSSTTNTDIVQDEILPGQDVQMPTRVRGQAEGAVGLNEETVNLKPDGQEILKDTKQSVIGSESARLILVGRSSPPPERLPSPGSTASISSILDPVMPSVEAVDNQTHAVLQKDVPKMQEKQQDRFQDTDYSSDSFSSDSEVDLPGTRPTKKPQQFFLEAEISHIPLEHPISPFLPDTETRSRFNSAATQKRAMSSRLLSSSYGTRSDVQVQAYNPLAEAKKTKKCERKVKKAKVAAEKADAKTKGLKRLKAMKNAYGNLKTSQRN